MTGMSRVAVTGLVCCLPLACGGNTSGGPGDAGPDTGPLPTDPCVAAGTCPAATWINVTPPGMAAVVRPSADEYGPGSIARDPARPSDIYVGGSSAGLWKSSDYGNTWALINDTLPDVPRGAVIAVAGTTPATIWAAGYNTLFKSVDGGQTFAQTEIDLALYSLSVDPNDPTHLISGLHEEDGIVESTDGGATWRKVGGTGFPSGGVSWYPFFIDTGAPAATRQTWFAIAQNGASAIMTKDQGATWSIPKGLAGLQHPHGNAQIFQSGQTLFAAGLEGPEGHGVYRSADLGATWSLVDGGERPQAVVWGTAKNVYSMYAWACSNCDLGTNFEIAAQPGTNWAPVAVPRELVIGPNGVVVTSDSVRNIFVGLMWDQGLWRGVAPVETGHSKPLG